MKSNNNIPRHVAIIMDGNGRWAKERGKERIEGHFEGVASIRRSVESAIDSGVEYLTIYAFSTENWGRPQSEVNALMELVVESVKSETPQLCKQGVSVKIIGDKTAFSPKVNDALGYIEEQTSAGEKLTMIIALNYSSRDEITRAMRQVATMIKKGEMLPEAIDAELISSKLDTAGVPDPDLIIRTSGEQRLSNFMLWQASYAELYFPDVLWPDFGKEEFERALQEYALRNRRYGVI